MWGEYTFMMAGICDFIFIENIKGRSSFNLISIVRGFLVSGDRTPDVLDEI